jgi:hypothetical protein
MVTAATWMWGKTLLFHVHFYLATVGDMDVGKKTFLFHAHFYFSV